MHPDDELTARLTHLLGDVDPVPPAVLAAARDALRWRDPDAELARLVAESAEPAAVRGDSAQLLTFAAGDLLIDVEVGRTGRLLHLVGQVAPPGAGRIQVEQPGRTVEATVDELGRFAVAGLSPGHTRLTYLPSAGTRVRTEWQIL